VRGHVQCTAVLWPGLGGCQCLKQEATDHRKPLPTGMLSYVSVSSLCVTAIAAVPLSSLHRAVTAPAKSTAG